MEINSQWGQGVSVSHTRRVIGGRVKGQSLAVALVGIGEQGAGEDEGDGEVGVVGSEWWVLIPFAFPLSPFLFTLFS